jgi:hypothetical protein
VEQCIQSYTDIAKKVFRKDALKFINGEVRFDLDKLITAVREMVERYDGRKTGVLSAEQRCRTFVVVMNGYEDDGTYKLYRSYSTNSLRADPSAIWEAVGATMPEQLFRKSHKAKSLSSHQGQHRAPVLSDNTTLNLSETELPAAGGGMMRCAMIQEALTEASGIWNSIARIFVMSIGVSERMTSSNPLQMELRTELTAMISKQSDKVIEGSDLFAELKISAVNAGVASRTPTMAQDRHSDSTGTCQFEQISSILSLSPPSFNTVRLLRATGQLDLAIHSLWRLIVSDRSNLKYVYELYDIWQEKLGNNPASFTRTLRFLWLYLLLLLTHKLQDWKLASCVNWSPFARDDEFLPLLPFVTRCDCVYLSS